MNHRKLQHILMAFTILALTNNDIIAIKQIPRSAIRSVSHLQQGIQKKIRDFLNLNPYQIKTWLAHTNETFPLVDLSPTKKKSREQARAMYQNLQNVHRTTRKNLAIKCQTHAGATYLSNCLDNHILERRNYHTGCYQSTNDYQKKDEDIGDMNNVFYWTAMSYLLSSAAFLFFSDATIESIPISPLPNIIDLIHDNGGIMGTGFLGVIMVGYCVFAKLSKKSLFPNITKYLSPNSLIQKKLTENNNLSPEVIDSLQYIENFKSLNAESKNAVSHGLSDSFAQSLNPIINNQQIEASINIIFPNENQESKDKELVFIIKAATELLSRYTDVKAGIAYKLSSTNPI